MHRVGFGITTEGNNMRQRHLFTTALATALATAAFAVPAGATSGAAQSLCGAHVHPLPGRVVQRCRVGGGGDGGGHEDSQQDPGQEAHASTQRGGARDH